MSVPLNFCIGTNGNPSLEVEICWSGNAGCNPLDSGMNDRLTDGPPDRHNPLKGVLLGTPTRDELGGVYSP